MVVVHVIKKVPGESIYYITGYLNDNNSYTQVVKFQINVGSTNTWDTYTIGTNIFYAQSKFTVLINKDENTKKNRTIHRCPTDCGSRHHALCRKCQLYV